MTLFTRLADNPGAPGVIEPAREFITDVETAAQLWPFGNRSPQSQQGIPLGMDVSGGVGCYDPYSSFMNGQQRAAQLGIIAANGLGKSVVCKKMATGFAGMGIPTIIPFDAKNEYLQLVRALGGSTLRVGRDGGLNLLDPGECIQQATARRVSEEILSELRSRRNQLVAAVAAISRNEPLKGWEFTALSHAIDQLPPGATIKHLPKIFSSRIEELASVLNRTVKRADVLLEPLALDIASMASGPIGDALGTSSPSQRWLPNVPLAVDTSAVLMAEPTLSAAVIVSCWTAALSTIYLANATSDTQIHAIIFDEIWRATREFSVLADQVGGLLRMDRNDGIISILSTHSWTDTEQAGGSNIMARCAAFALGGMQKAEVDKIANAGIGLNEAELSEIRNNASGGSSMQQAKGGIGRFLFKVAEQPGRIIQTVLTPTEKRLLDTNQKWTRPATNL